MGNILYVGGLIVIADLLTMLVTTRKDSDIKNDAMPNLLKQSVTPIIQGNYFSALSPSALKRIHCRAWTSPSTRTNN
ncbi:MAG: hypothetical protein WCP96_03740 [Methylococcaceae bacterium]